MTISRIASGTTVPTSSAEASATSAASTGDFTQQLSQALSDSLQKLGNTPADIHIQVQSGSGAATRQFVITYTDPQAGSTSSAASADSPAPTRTHNPFDGSALGIGLADSPSNTPSTPGRATTPWSPWNGPCDPRDAVPPGGGQTTASGAPLIQPNATPTSNQYNYAGPAAYNPYFTNPGNPLREGYVLGFNNWFQAAQIVGPKATVSANEFYYASEDGANEALRLVKQYVPKADLKTETFGSGPFTATRPTWMVSLPDGRTLNAGRILDAYYNHGCGVCISSDSDLQQTIGSTLS